MRLKRSMMSKGFWLMIVLIVVLCGMGAVQGQWTSTLGVQKNLLTGKMNLIYGEDEAFRMAIADRDGKEINSLGKVDYQFVDKTKKKVELKLGTSTSWLEQLMDDPEYILKIQYYIEPAADSSIEKIVPEKADLTKTSAEKITFCERDLQLESGNTIYALEELPSILQKQIGTVDLEWNVYREISQEEVLSFNKGEETEILATVYLTLTDSSRRALANAKSATILLDESTDEATVAEVEEFFSAGENDKLSFIIHSNYTFTLDLALQQA